MPVMMGLMQNWELTTAALIDHAARSHGTTEIVSCGPDNTLHRTNWREVSCRARQLAAGLQALGVEAGDRVATLAWNRTAHLELYFGVTAAGMVLHTVNPRLFPDQIQYIIDHGGAQILFVDPDLLAILEPFAARMKHVRRIVVLCARNAIPASSLADLIAYEDLIGATDPLSAWPRIDEQAACILCYTSGTTGDPKGVLYSHRSSVLHAFAACAADSMAISACDSILLITPLFHVNAWGVPFAAAMAGAKLVLPGMSLDGKAIFALLRDENVTFSLGVPTVWFTLLDYLVRETTEDSRAALPLNRVLMGGAAVPLALIERLHALLGAVAIQAWGMTETSPVATVSRPLRCHEGLGKSELFKLQATQGRAVFGVELRIEDQDGQAMEHDGVQSGLLKVRGPWIISRYFTGAPALAESSTQSSVADTAIGPDGWFDTGDIATIDADGYLRITDRAKDVIKSGGEWISSIDLENAALSHPAVAEAAVIGVPHARWQERPIMLVRLNSGDTVTASNLIEHLSSVVARWWLPDDVVFVDALPHTATGKLLKTELRLQYRDHLAAPK